MTDRIEADYQSLNRIVNIFAQQSNQIMQMHRRIAAQTNSLSRGGWRGRGSDAFYREMNDLVLPGVQRLGQALEEASRVTKQVSDDIAKAEQEASAPFRAQ
jgi:WXG100 family type VII secretion target